MKRFKFINIEKDSEIHIKYLFEILKKRIFNISHAKLPSFEEHKEFVLKNPYRFWKLIKLNNEIIGNFYIGFDNSIAINLLDHDSNLYLEIIEEILNKYKPLKENKSLRSKYFIFNSNPKNHFLIEALEKIGSEHIQNTYAYKKD